MDQEQLRSITGTIFNIQHYCIHDGPGIRTNVFVKGCPLHCLWCANPESQNPSPQLMYRSDLCVGCRQCAMLCPNQAISFSSGSVAKTNRMLCSACGKCVDICPKKAREITGYKITAGEVFDEIAQDVLFYGEDGGVTVTGGEALSQPIFTAAILQLCKEAGIHTAIETCGFAKWENITSVLQYTDLVLFDVKETDPDLHKKYTGVDNRLILENLRKINDLTSCEIWVRVPTIPGYNDDASNITATGQFVQKYLPHCTQIHLLPFHKLGEGKFDQLENTPNGFHSEVPSDTYMESLRTLIRNLNIICK